MNEPVEWDDEVPEGLRAVLQDLVEEADDEDGGPLDVLARLLEVPIPSIRGLDARLWVREQVASLDARRVYEFIVRLSAGGSRYDGRATKALAAAGIDLELVDGIFYRRDTASEFFDVDDILTEPASRLKGKFSSALQSWTQSRKALADREFELAVSQAAVALESVVVTITGKNKIDPGLKKLFSGARWPLALAIVQLHNFASAMPGVRHGSAEKSDMAAAEARGLCRAVAAYIVMLIDLYEGGELTP